MKLFLNILLLPLKLILKLILYIIAGVIWLIGALISLLGAISLPLSHLVGFISLGIGVIFLVLGLGNLISPDFFIFKDFPLATYWILIVFGGVFGGFVLALPYISVFLGTFLIESADAIRDFASFGLFGRKNVYQQYESRNADSEYAYDEFYEYEPSEEEMQAEREWRERKAKPVEPEAQKSFGFFDGITNLEDLKKRYKSLARCYHPDTSAGETDETMAHINNEYERLKLEFEKMA